MEARTNRRRLAVIIGGAAVVLSVGVAMVAANPNPPTSASTSAYSASLYGPQLAAWANANGLTGSSPAGLSVPVHTVEQAEVAAWAVANGLTGPSPSSLRSIDD